MTSKVSMDTRCDKVLSLLLFECWGWWNISLLLFVPGKLFELMSQQIIWYFVKLTNMSLYGEVFEYCKDVLDIWTCQKQGLHLWFLQKWLILKQNKRNKWLMDNTRDTSFINFGILFLITSNIINHQNHSSWLIISKIEARLFIFGPHLSRLANGYKLLLFENKLGPITLTIWPYGCKYL